MGGVVSMLQGWMGLSSGDKGSKAEEDAERKRRLRENVAFDDHKIPVEELLERTGANLETGFSTAEAKRRNEEIGLNQLTPPAETPLWVKFIQEMTGFFALLLWGGSLLCFISFSIRQDLENLYLGIVLAVVVFTTGVFSFYQNSKSEQLMKSFQALEAPPVTTLRDGERRAVESKFLCKGDIVTLNAGDVVPADVRILECTDDTVVDNAALTGESEPQKRRPEASDDNPLETANLAFFGTTVPNGSLTGIIVNIGDDTVMGKIAALTLTTEDEQTPINAEIEHFIHIISAIAIFLGVSFFAIGFGFGQDITSALVFMIGIIVANVPEGLLATVTVSLTLTAVKMFKKQVRVKNLEGVETLGSTSCICSDKTGTLTQNIMTVAQIVYGGASGFNIEDCASSFTRGNKTYDESNPSFKKLQRCATLCNTAFFEPASMTDPETGEKKPFLAQVLQGDGSFITQVAWEPAQGCNASEVAMIKFTQPLRDVLEYRNRCPIIKDATIPFNSKNKYQVHVHCQEEYQPEGSTSPEDNTGPRIVCMKGAPERVIGRCSHALVNGELVQMTAQLKEEIAELQLQLSENGLRVLGFAEKEMPLNQYPPDFVFEPNPAGFSTANYPLGEFMNHQGESKDDQKEGDPPHPNSLEGLVFLGLMALVDPPRPAVPGAVNKCKTAGIKVIMVTGDHPITAQAIAYKVGILWSKTKNIMELENKRYNRHPGDAGWQDPDDARAIVVPGHTIDAEMGEDKWDAILEHPQIVFARTSPQQKLIIVENCKRVGHIVAVTGDGVNDAPALKAANIGVAMGITGTEVSKRAADMILLDDNFASIVNGVEEGRLIFDNLKKSICYTLTSNIPEITPFLAFIVLAIPLPLSTVLILAIDLGTDMVPAISMAYEEAEADIMKRPPRNAKVDRLVTSKLIILAYLQIGVMQAAAGFYTYMVVLNDYGFPPHILLGLGAANNWQRQPLFCRFSGGRYVDPDGNIDLTRDPTNDAPSLQFPLWDSGADGYVIDCQHPLKNLEGGSGLPGGFEFDEVDTYDAAETLRESLITAESIQALEADGYYYYVPWRARMSPFWNENWLNWDIEDVEAPGGSLGGAADILYFANQPAGLWSICAADPGLQSESKTPAVGPEESRIRGGNYVACDAGVTTSLNAYRKAFFCNGDIEENYNTEQFPDIYTQCAMFDDFALNLRYCERRCDWQCVRDSEFVSSAGRTAENNDDFNQCANIASRMTQKEALHHAQGAFFVTIVIVQWADLLICKTRWLSIRAQGMRNQVMNFGLYFETVLAAFLCYIPAINLGLGTRNIRLTHWFPGMPWSMLIFVYDELRKYLMRSTSPEVFDKATGQVTRVKGWIERFTYY